MRGKRADRNSDIKNICKFPLIENIRIEQEKKRVLPKSTVLQLNRLKFASFRDPKFLETFSSRLLMSTFVLVVIVGV